MVRPTRKYISEERILMFIQKPFRSFLSVFTILLSYNSIFTADTSVQERMHIPLVMLLDQHASENPLSPIYSMTLNLKMALTAASTLILTNKSVLYNYLMRIQKPLTDIDHALADPLFDPTDKVW